MTQVKTLTSTRPSTDATRRAIRRSCKLRIRQVDQMSWRRTSTQLLKTYVSVRQVGLNLGGSDSRGGQYSLGCILRLRCSLLGRGRIGDSGEARDDRGVPHPWISWLRRSHGLCRSLVHGDSESPGGNNRDREKPKD